MEIKRTDLKISFQCNNRCLFCVQGDKRDRCAPKSMQQIEEELNKGRISGSNELLITGGEPSINKDIFSIIRMAKKTGYKSIQLQTNGRLLRYRDFCKELADSGLTEVCPSLHGSSAEIHDFLTSSPGAFKETVTGILNAAKIGLRVSVNTVITKPNQQDLPRIAKLLCALGIKHFQFSFVHICGNALKNSKWLIGKYSVIMPFVHKALDIGIMNNVICLTEAIPYCFMKGYEPYVAERVISDMRIFDADQEVPEYGDYRLSYGKMKGKNCKKCAYCDICEGPWSEYPKIFGWEEFIPQD